MHNAASQVVSYYWLIAAVCGVAAPWALYRSLLSVRRDRLVEDTPLVKIRSAAQGYVKLSGRAACAPAAALTAPLTSRPCVWWRYSIEHRIRNSKGESRWESVDSGTSIDLFALADGDGECLVGPAAAEVTPTTHDVWYGALSRPSGPPQKSGGMLQVGDYRYTESLLSEGDRLCVLGELRSHSEIGSADANAAALLKQWKLDQKTLVARFDQNHDGRIDAAEWEAARQAAVNEAKSQNLSAPITRMSVIGQPGGSEPFLIAAMDDAHIVRREKLHAGLFFGLGLVCAGLCAWGIEHAQAASAASASHGYSGVRFLIMAGAALGPSLVVFASRFLRRAA
jgi:hypothetical protein